jgi:hypothetical protein
MGVWMTGQRKSRMTTDMDEEYLPHEGLLL